VVVELRDHLVQVLGFPLGKLVPVAQSRDARPDVLPGRAEQLEDVEELLELGVAGEERLLPRELGEDAPDGPDVHRGGVVRAAQQNFGSSVPQRDDLVRVRFNRHGEGASEAEVGNLDDVLGFVDEEVLGLEVAVHDAVAVDVRAAEAQLVHKVLDDLLLDGIRGASAREVHEPLEVLVEVLEDEVQHSLAVFLDVLHLEQPACVCVSS
jgi:hypothetical protein